MVWQCFFQWMSETAYRLKTISVANKIKHCYHLWNTLSLLRTDQVERGNSTLVHVTMRVGTLSIWRGASHMWYMSKDFLGFIHSVSKGNIVGNLWFGYNCQFYTQITQNWENLVISGLFKWHKFTSYPSHSAIYCVYWSKITNLSWNIIK